jgi:hypothetical protein
MHGRVRWLYRLPLVALRHATVSTVPRVQGQGRPPGQATERAGMRQFEQDWLELGSRVARSLHYQHPRNLRLVQAAEAGQTARPAMQEGAS